MAANPQSFFRFAARYYPLLADLFSHDQGLSEADLRKLIEPIRAEGDPAPEKVIEQLQAFTILEPVPDATASYELTTPVRDLLSFLLREHRLTSTKVLQVYLSDLSELREELDSAARQNMGRQAARALKDISELLERLRQDSHSNREGIIGEVIKLKSNRERRTIRERFEIINHLWSRYLEPLRDLIDVKKAMDRGLDDLDCSLTTGGTTFVLDGGLVREFSRCRARLLRLRREMTEDFHESIREVEPLYISLKKESELVRGASLALERMDRSGLASLQLQEMMAIPVWRIEGSFADTSLEAFLHGIKGYQPGSSEPLTDAAEPTEAGFIPPTELFERLESALPVDDLLAWLLENYPQVELGELVRAYGRVFLDEPKANESKAIHFGKAEQRYPLDTATLVARPMRLEKMT
ncbi:SGNH/GDSL hydrolase family protein [Desulfogranum mediterraneum]|uniref:hypothetical protein n=1 Tax=Desulfogranum mediterraneum TaxID=160661 RepID=UPI0003F5FF16|nr:hypothetical protein [Desulfogranum mediterraneum]